MGKHCPYEKAALAQHYLFFPKKYGHKPEDCITLTKTNFMHLYLTAQIQTSSQIQICDL